MNGQAAPPARVLIVAGEASGDLYGGLLMQAMSHGAGERPESGAVPRAIEFTGIGGPSMRAAGLRLLGDASALGVTGLFEVVGRFASILGAYRAVGAAL